MPKTTAEAEQVRRELLRELLPPDEQPVSEDELMATMMEVFRRAGTPPDLVYAAQKTRRIVTDTNKHLLSDEELAEWDAGGGDECDAVPEDRRPCKTNPDLGGLAGLRGPDRPLGQRSAAGSPAARGTSPDISPS